MKRQELILWGAAALAGACLFGSDLTPVQAGPPSETDSAAAQTNSVASKTQPPDTDTKNVVVKKQLTGAELYSMHCNRCHQERYPTERTGAQWKTIMLHMQVRANIPVSQAKLILQYLQENSGR
jgi:cytochrome c5